MSDRLPRLVSDVAVSESPEAYESAGLLQIAWRHKLLLLSGAAVGLVLGALYYSRQTPVYQSNAEVLVVQKQPAATISAAGAQAGMTYVEDYVTAQARVIRSPLIVERAVASGKMPSGHSAGDVIDALSVDLEGNILALSFRGPHPEDCAQVLEAVIASYQDFLNETYKNANEETLQQITERVTQLRKDLENKEKRYQELLEDKPLALHAGEEGASLYERELAAIHAKLSELKLERIETLANLAVIRQAIESQEDRAALIARVEDMAARQEEDAAARQESAAKIREERQAARQEALDRDLLPLLLRENELLADFGPDHPEVATVRKQVEMVREMHRRREARERELEEAESALVEDEPRDRVQDFVQSLERKLETIERSEKELLTLLEQQHEKAKQLTNYAFQDRQANAEISRDEKFYEGLIAQLQGINLSKDLGGYNASVIAPPALGRRVAPSASRTLLAALLMGLMGGLGLTYLAELTDKSFRTPEEIRRRLGLPVVGQIPHIPALAIPENGARARTIDSTVCAYHHPRSLEAESYRGVRTALLFGARRDGLRVVQVTSPNKGDGKTTLATNLAVSIAKVGERVLLVDADLRKPRVHRLFGLSSGAGLSSVVSGEVELADAIQESGVQGLQILPCGPIPSNPAELLTSPRFEELLNLLREQFDFVLVDTPPLLAVTDPSVVAPRVDGVLLTLRLTKEARTHAERAVDILHALEANVLGVVVNDKDQARGGYGYGYGRGPYGYGGYGDEDHKHYYREEEEGAVLDLPRLEQPGPESANGEATTAPSSR